MASDSVPAAEESDRSRSGEDPVELLRVVLREAARQVTPPAPLPRSLLGEGD